MIITNIVNSNENNNEENKTSLEVDEQEKLDQGGEENESSLSLTLALKEESSFVKSSSNDQAAKTISSFSSPSATSLDSIQTLSTIQIIDTSCASSNSALVASLEKVVLIKKEPTTKSLSLNGPTTSSLNSSPKNHRNRNKPSTSESTASTTAASATTSTTPPTKKTICKINYSWILIQKNDTRFF